jgi:hypothetical protein
MQPRMSMKYQRKIDSVRMDGWIKTINIRRQERIILDVVIDLGVV